MLTVRDIANLPGLGLELAAGASGADNPISWVHVSELPDPTPWLEGGELLITTGLGVGALSRPQREYVRRLAGHGLAGLAFGVGFGWAEPPAALADEAELLDFPLVTVPYEVPFIALTKAISSQLANAQLARLERALEVHERLAHSVLEGQGAPALLAILGDHVGCALALVDEAGRVVGERHSARLAGCDHVLELPVVAEGETWSLRAGKPHEELSDYDRLVLHHGQSALAFELSRRNAVSAAELRLAGDLLEDLEHDRLDEREIARRIAAFGLDPQDRYAALLAVAVSARQADDVRSAAARVLDARGTRYLSASRRDRAAFLVATDLEEDALTIARELVEAAPGTRVGRRSSRVGVGPRTQPARGARRPRRGRRAGRLLPGSRLARAAAEPAGSRAGGVRRPRAGAGVGEHLAARVAGGAARHRLPLERRGRPARRPPAHAPLPDGPAAQADRAASRRPVPAHGTVARRQGQAGDRGAGGRAGGRLRRLSAREWWCA